MFFSLVAITSAAYEVEIEGYTSTGTENGYPLFAVDSGTINIRSANESSHYYFNCVYIDDVRVTSNDYPWSFYLLNITPYFDGQPHKIQLIYGSSDRGICYFIVPTDANTTDGIFYLEDGENASVAGAIPNITTAVISSTFTKDGTTYPVTSIVANAFKGKSKLTSVTIPTSVTTIGDYAFHGCSGLTSVTIPENVTSIGGSAFAGTGLTSLDFNAINCSTCGSSDYPAFPPTISTLTTGDKVTNIPNSFLRNCSAIENLVLPNSVTTIGSSAFYGCSGLSTVTLPNSVTSIADFAFYDCSVLPTVNIPNSVTSIGSSAFYGCSGLSTVTLPNSLTSIADFAFYGCSKLTMVNIPNSVTSIGSAAFYGCSGLSTVTLSNSVTSIGSSAFYGCTRLTSVTIPENVESIGRSAFVGTGLTSLEFNAVNCSTFASSNYSAFPATISTLTIGDKVTIIPNYAFYGCSGLTSVTLSNSLTSIGSFAFYGCSELTSVTIPENVTSIGSCAFAGSGLTSLDFNAVNCSYCGSSKYPAFPTTISTLTIGDKVTIIPEYFLSDGSNIENLTIPNSVTSIGNYAFLNANSKLKSLTVGSGVLRIGDKAFSEYCSNKYSKYSISKVFWLGNTPPTGYDNINGIVNYVANEQYSLSNKKIYRFLSSKFTVDGTTYIPVSPSEKTCDVVDCIYAPRFESTVIGDKVTYRGVEMTVLNVNERAFYGNDFTKSLTASNQGYIGEYAFYSCDSLERVQTTNAGYIDESAFQDCSNLQSAEIRNAGSIGSSAFRSCGLRTVDISNTGAIGSYAFAECSNLQTATIQNTGDIGYSAFEGCCNLQTATIQNTGKIGTSAFEGCVNLQTATIQNTGDIGSTAFYGCQKLQSVTLGDKVTGIGYECFYNCSALRELTVPNSVVSLGEEAFCDCSSLERITLGTGIHSLPAYVLAGCSSLSTITIPNNIASIDNYAFFWCSSLADINIVDANDSQHEEETLTFPYWTSTNYSDGSTSQKEYTFEVKTGYHLDFDYSVNSESGYDFLIVKIDNELVVKESGNKSGHYHHQFDSAKEVTLYMAYTKDSSGNSGSDNASVTNIVVNGQFIDRLTLGSNGSSPLFSSCPLDEVYIGRRISYQTDADHGYSPFYRNTSLRSVEISDAETRIYDNEFYGCTNLASLKIGNGVTSIGNWAFSGCSSLNYFSAGYMVETIGKEAFSDCTGLSKYYSYSVTPPVCGEQALDDINKWECTLFVPAESRDEYQAAPQWKDFFFTEEMDAVLVAELRLDSDGIILDDGQTVQLSVEVLPANATYRTVAWSSSDESVATVDQTGMVMAIAEGTATITVKSSDGNAETSTTVTVRTYTSVDGVVADKSGDIEVFTTSGIKVSNNIDNLTHGIYIVRQGSLTRKIIVN